MIAHKGIVTRVSEDGRHAQVKLALTGAPTRMLPCSFPLGLIIPPRVGDDVLVVPTGSGLEDAVIIGWQPQSADLIGALKLIVSDNGSLPSSTDPGSPIGNASVTNVKVRAPEVE